MPIKNKLNRKVKKQKMSDFIERLVESRKQGDYMYQKGRRDAEKELNALGECEYRKGRADAIEEIDNLIAEMTEIAESQMMLRHAEICELIRERIKVNMDDSKRINS